MRSKSGVMRGFQKGITLGGRTSGSDMLISWVCKIGLQKMCKIFASEFGSKSGVMRGFQKGLILGSMTSRSVRKV